MSGNDTTSGIARRSSNSPDLWIPYILIGLACVTFLAIHFWCYHKRNRERYLRKRDEKRVKSGLMERRRITTLMLAKYQSDLGITKREKDIDMTRLFYDNSVDVVDDEHDHHYHNSTTTKTPPSHNSPANAQVATSVAENVAASASLSHARSKTLANSQTWPLATERKNTPHNAHDGGVKDTKITETSEDKTAVIVTNNDPGKNTDLSTPKDEHHNQISVDVLIPHQGTNRGVYIGNSFQKMTHTLPRPDKGRKPQAVVLKSYSSPSSYPSVFYTGLNSPHSTHSSFLSAFKPKHKKRRHEASSITDPERTSIVANESIGVKWTEFSSLYEPKKPCSDSSSIYSASNHSNCYSLVGNEQFCCGNRKLEKSGCVFPETETSAFAEAGLVYGSFSHNSATENMQMIPMSDFARKSLSETTTSTTRCSSNVNIKNPAGEQDSLKTSPTIDVHTWGSSITAPTVLPNNFPHKNIIIPFSEKSRLNIISKNPAKIRTSHHHAYGNTPSTQFWLPRQRSGPLTKIDYVDNKNSIQERCEPQHENSGYSTYTDPTRLSSISETALHNPAAGLSVRGDNPKNGGPSLGYVGGGNTSLSNDNDPAGAAENIPGTVSNYELSSSTLRDLNKSLVFHSAKRKFGIKSE